MSTLCPSCDSSLTDYVLLRKLMSGLYSVVLREEVFRNFASFSDVDSLRSYCTAFEAAHKDAGQDSGGKPSVAQEGAVAAAAAPQPGVADSCCAATNTHHPCNKSVAIVAANTPQERLIAQLGRRCATTAAR